MTEHQDYLANDQFAKLLGIRVTERSAEHCSAEMVIRAEHLNGLGSVHGAVLFALADVAFAAASNSDSPTIALQSDIRYIARAQGEQLVAKATQTSVSRKTTTYQIDIFDSSHTKVALFSGTGYRF